MRTKSSFWKCFRLFVIFMLAFGNLMSLPAAALAQDDPGEEPAPAETAALPEEEQAAPVVETEEAPPVVEEPAPVEMEADAPAEEDEPVTIQADEPVDPLAIDYAWVAYNDCAWVSGQTETNITKYTIPDDGTASGLLMNYATGSNSAVTATFTASGSPSVVTGNYGGSETTSGTDAYTTFHGIADMPGVIQYGNSGWYVDLTFTDLDPAKTYTFATSANRDGGYTERITIFTLSGDDGATNASTAGVTEITENSVSFLTGENTDDGYVARWTGINPGSDGTISIRAEATASEYRAYAMSVFMLAEEVGSTPTIETTGTLTAFLTEPGVPSTPQTYTVEAVNLTANLLIDPPDGFEVSQNGSDYFSGLELVPASGEVPLTTIYVRLNNPAEGTFSGDIAHTSTGAATKNVAVTGQVAPMYTLTVNSSHGTVTLNPSGGVYTAGTSVQLTANEESGYEFSSWYGDLSGSDNPKTIVMDSDKTVTAIFAELVTVNLVAAEDTWMNAANTSYNYGGATTISVNARPSSGGGSSSRQGALFQWDVSAIPVNAVIDSASLTLYVSDPAGSTFSLYDVLRDWVEGTSDGAASTTSANWNTYDGTTTWTSGGAGSTSDRGSANLWGAGSSTFNSNGSKTVALNSSGEAVVQNWIDGDLTNNGVTIQNYTSGTTTNYLKFTSSEGTEANRPKLNITYYVPISGPTITLTGALQPFNSQPGVDSMVQSYTVAGTLLTEDLVITPDSTDFQVSTSSSSGFGPSLTLPQSGGTVAEQTIYVRFNRAAAGSSSGVINHTSSGATAQTQAVSGTAAAGELIISGALTPFSSPIGVNSAEQSYTLSGSYLVGDVTVTAPADFQISKTTGSGFASSLTFTPTNGTLASSTIYVRFNRATLGDSSGNITHTTAGVTQQDVAVSGTATPTPVTVTYQEGVSSYAGTIDTTIKFDEPTSSYGNQVYFEWDKQESSGTTPETGLLQFGNIFGSAAGQVPLGSTIYAATLQYRTYTNSNSNGDDASVYESLVSWDEDSTYNTFGGDAGVQTDEYNSTLVATAEAGSNNTNYTIDVTASLQRWSDGTANYGWIFLADDTDGVEVHSSESSTNSYRPLLTVSYIPAIEPTITVNSAMTAFVTEPGVASAPQTYTVEGSNLEADISISAPAGFEISTDGVNYASSLTLTHSGGVVAETTIHVRLFSATAGNFSGNIAHTSTDADTQNAAVSGAVKNKYTLVVGNDGNGSVTLDPAGGSYYDGTTVTLTPAPLSGFAFSEWTGVDAGDVVNTGGVYTIVMNGDKALTANFVAQSTVTVTFQSGVAGYTATDDTFIRGTTDGGVNFGSETDLQWDQSTTAGEYALIRFDNLFTTEGGPIPEGVVISSATLSYMTTDLSSGSTAEGDPANVYESLVAWDGSTVTYNTFGSTAGVQTADYNATPVVTANATAASTVYSIDVTTSLQSWSTDPDANLGWIFVPTADDGVNIYASEEATVSYRPSLSVTYLTGSVVQHTLSVSNDGNGTVTLDPTAAGNLYDHNAVVTLTPVPASGYEFAIWSGTNDSDPTDNGDGTWSIIVDEDKAITANFSLLPINIAPNLPALVQPADDATGVSLPPTLEVTVSDDNPGDKLDVGFYGRQAGVSTSEDFTLVVFPDTQNESQYYPAVYVSQAQWIVDNADDENIVFVTHVGDIVNTSSDTTQWDNAVAAMNLIDTAGIPYSVGPGNHDGNLYATSKYENYFGVSRFEGKSWYGGHYSTTNFNNYSLFSASGMDFILINLEYNAGTNQLNWADQLLKDYSDRRGIVVQHNILNTNNTWQQQAPYTALKDNPNLFLMLCGHMHSSSDGAAYRSELGDDGHTIHIMLADYQDFPHGGDGYLRILRFSPADEMIYATTYSPYLDAYITSTTNYDQTNMAYDMANGTGGTYTLIDTVDDVDNGDNASISWTGLAAGTEYEWYATVSDGQETVTGSSWSFTTGSINNPPVITEGESIGVSMSEDGSPTAFSLTLHATDADSDPIEWSIQTQASFGVASVSGTGASKAIGYVPGLNYFGGDSFVVQVSDGKGGTDSITVNVTIAAVNDAPVLSAIGAQSGNELALLSFYAIASDAETLPGALLFSLSGEPTGAVIGAYTGLFAWTPTEAQGGTGAPFSFDVCVSDGVLSDCETIAVTVNEVNVAPVLAAIGSQSVNELVELQFTAAATDVDVPANTFAYSLTGAPAGAGIDEDTGAFTWTPTEAQGGTGAPFSFDVCVSDGSETDCETIAVTVNEVNVAPVLAAIGNRSVAKDETLTFTAAASDVDKPDNTLTFSLADGTGGDVPDGASIGATSGEFSWTPATADDATFDVCVSDGLLPDCETITVTVTDESTFTISGQVGVDGATLTYDGGSTVSGTGGAYSITVAAGWSGTVTPSLAGFVFTPASRTYSNVQADAANQDYTADMTDSQDIALAEGWNLVSFRVHPTSTAVADVLASVAGNYDLVYAWDAVNDGWLKKDNVPESPDDLDTLDETRGFWIHMTAADTLTVSGTIPFTTNIALSSNGGGWNLVGYPSTAGGALPGILTSHGVAAENLGLVYAYHAAEADSWKLFDSNGAPYANDLTTLSAGWGYWIQIDTADDTWEVTY